MKKETADIFDSLVRTKLLNKYLNLSWVRDEGGRAAYDMLRVNPDIDGQGRKRMRDNFAKLATSKSLSGVLRAAETLAAFPNAALFANFGEIIAHERQEGDLKQFSAKSPIAEIPRFSFLFWPDPDAVFNFEKTEPAGKPGYYFYKLVSADTAKTQANDTSKKG